MRLIVALGNPGPDYKNTRHNAGFIFIDKFCEAHNLNFKKEFFGDFVKTKISNEDVIFFKPLTYMNLSGQPTQMVKAFFKVDTEDIMIIHDETNLAFEDWKISKNRTSAGHNGVQNIFDQLKTKDITRLRIGIGSNKSKILKDFVLEKFSIAEMQKLNETLFDQFNVVVLDFLKMDTKKLMNKYNVKPTN